MANNFTKKEAKLLFEGASGPDKFKFADEQKNSVMTFFKERSYAAAYGSGLPVKEISKGSVTYHINAGKMAIVPKGDTIGTGAIAKEKTGFVPKTVYLASPGTISGGFQESDLMQGLENAVLTKYTQALNTFDTDYERKFLAAVCKNGNIGTTNVIDPSTIDTADKAKAAKTKLVDAAFAMAEIVEPKYALDGIDENRIFIDLSSALFNRLVDERLIVDAAKQVFQQGIFMTGTMGGFTVRRVEYLGKADMLSKDSTGAGKGLIHAIIATDVTACGPRAFVAANAGHVGDLSEDKAYFIEQKVASVDGTALSYAVMGIETLLQVFGTAK